MSICLVLFSVTTAAYAGTEKSGFDYSAENMECTILPPVIDTEESEKTWVGGRETTPTPA